MKFRVSSPIAVGVCLLVAVIVPVAGVAQPSKAPFAIVPGSFQIEPATLQAGAHGNLTTVFDFAHTKSGKTDNDLKTTVVNLPPGFTGNNTAVPTCTDEQLIGADAGEPNCPPASQVGTITLDLTAIEPVESTFAVYNMEVTTPGVTAQLGFDAVVINEVLNVSVRPGDAGLTVTAPKVEGGYEPRNISVTIWGVPGLHEHDAQRGQRCYEPSPEGTNAGVAVKNSRANPGPFSRTRRAASVRYTRRCQQARGRNRKASLKRLPKSLRSPNANAYRSLPRSKRSRAHAPLNRRAG